MTSEKTCLKEIDRQEYVPCYVPCLDSSFQTLMSFNEADDYEAVRPLYGQAQRIFEYGVQQAKANSWFFKRKLGQYEKFLTREVTNSGTGITRVEADDVVGWAMGGNDTPHWIKLAVEPYIGAWVDEIDKTMQSFGRPGFWGLLKGQFGRVAQKKHLRKYADLLEKCDEEGYG